ncbi:uncharacterized protein LOC127291250 [Leptopilina boulardi]|uniref:uncharacterized protein LOC127291250 n=1 Tax=Leptopilina boulardi TaxID=63433 RepID=UPI0021F52EB6|nr:uncharacterized protein LOC127291250 [Leptopilina boulardi]
MVAVIWEELSPWYVRPRTQREWMLIAAGFRARWYFSNVLGALDGKEFKIRPLPHTGTLYYNYKKFTSIKMMATCDAFYRFTWVDVGNFVFRNTHFYEDLRKGCVDLPPSCELPRTRIKMPYFFIVDKIFLATEKVIIPFARRYGLDAGQKNFNYRLSKARHTIEAAFGILTATWQILKDTLKFKVETSINIVLATVCLHNFLITRRLQRGEEVQWDPQNDRFYDVNPDDDDDLLREDDEDNS